MREMSVRELRESLSSIGDIVEREQEVVLTRHGRPVAKLIPVKGGRAVPSHADLRGAMPRMRRPSQDLIREDRERG